MASELKITGAEELLAELTALAPDLAAEARTLEQAITEQTAEDLRAAYPVVTGELAGSVQVVPDRSRSPVRVFTQVVVTAPYAEFYEFGTVRTVPHPTFVPTTNRGRRAFLTAVIARVQRHGLRVDGEAS